ncbi:MAG: hypothetical protein H7282_07735 [Cytophagaceae bacterium]|nr:hypothetical protein [Cytophagaceae bacterium]
MKNTFLLVVISLFLAACSSEISKEKDVPLSSTDASLQETRTENVLDLLYLELKEQRPELIALDKQIKEVDQAKEKALGDYKKYNSKNEQYYLTANQYLNNIKDSLLRNSVELLLNKSQYAYDQENAAMALAAAQLENRSVSLHDHQEALKIILTMNLMEKYQKKQLSDDTEYQKIVDRYNQSIDSADSLLQAK